MMNINLKAIRSATVSSFSSNQDLKKRLSLKLHICIFLSFILLHPNEYLSLLLDLVFLHVKVPCYVGGQKTLRRFCIRLRYEIS